MRMRNVIFAVIIVLLWASTTVVGRFLVGVEPTISPVQLAFYRYVTGFLMLAVIYQIASSRSRPATQEMGTNEDNENVNNDAFERNSPWFHIFTGITLGLFPLLLFESVKYTTATAASFLLNSNTIFIAPLSAVFLNDRIPKMQVVGIILATTGIFMLLIGIDPVASWLTSETFLGNMIALAAGLTWAAYTIMSKKWFFNESPLRVTLIQLGIASAFLFLVVLVFDRPLIVTNVTTWLLILVIGPGATGLGFWLYFMILEEESATTTGSIQYLVPIVSLMYEWLFLNTLIPVVAIAGGLLTLIGLVIADYYIELQQVLKRQKAQNIVLGAKDE